MFWLLHFLYVFFFFKQKTAYEMRISDWSSDVCSSDLQAQKPSSLLTILSIMHRIGNPERKRPPAARRGAKTCPTLICGKSHAKIGRASCRERVCQYV